MFRKYIKKYYIILLVVFILFFICWSFPVQTQAEQASNIPEAVLNYGNLKENNDFYYVKDWNGYEVYTPKPKNYFTKEDVTPPQIVASPIFLLYDGKTVRRDVGEEYLNFYHKGRIILYRERPH